MIKEFTYDEILNILKDARINDPIPKYSDSERWIKIINNPILARSFDNYKDFLNRQLEEQLTLIPASLYLNFRRTGSRSPHDNIVSNRRSRLISLVIGECIEREGRFMDAIMDVIWAICEESSWVIPAHSRTTLPEYTNIKWIDLVSAETGRVLAEAIYMIGEKLDKHDPMICQRAIYEIKRRCWEPYIKYDDLWWMFAKDRQKLNNWTAVCNCGVVGSAILIMNDLDILARMIEKCLKSMNDFLKCFDKDGGCDEGPGYWGYGVSNYVWLSYLLEMRTEGKITLLDAPEMKGIAMFPQRATLSGNNVANFSDCSPKVSFSPTLMFYLGKRLDMPQVKAFAQYQYELNYGISGRSNVRDLAWVPEQSFDGKRKPERHVYYQEMQWMISRADENDEKTLILAAKGGHNAENHNQNDIGSFIVHYGGESLIIDLGAGTYTRDYFSAKRYEILVNSSWGHNVPLINGYQQPPGAQYAAKVLSHGSSKSEDFLELDMTMAYPSQAGLKSLIRRMSLHRKPEDHQIRIDDQIQLEKNTGSCKCPLYVVGKVTKEGNNKLSIIGEKSAVIIEYLPEIMDPYVEKVETDDKRLSENISRIIFDIPINNGSGYMNLKIIPK